MILAPLTRHLAVCAQVEVQSMLNRDKNFWHVLSIRDIKRSRLTFQASRSVFPIYFDDIVSVKQESPDVVIGRDQAEEIWRFVNKTAPEALLIHCVAGLSRSTAVASAIIAHSLIQAGIPIENVPVESVERLLTVRPPAAPNPIVLRRMLDMIMPPDLSRELAQQICSEPRVLANRFQQ
jgi:predicted protein tyrosine phosphatase